jgi:protein gp37
MGDKTGIEWTDATWNPVTGCTHVSTGCDHCYAASLASGRLAHLPAYEGLAEDGKFNGTIRLLPERLDQPLRWKKPRMIFVNSMSDLFHDGIPDAYIGTVFDVMARATQHTFQVLTKRPGRMRSLLSRWTVDGIQTDPGYLFPPHRPVGSATTKAPLWTPPPNVWLGTSAEDQKWADVRIPQLLGTPAAVRFVSAEPLLGPIDLGLEFDFQRRLDWVIVGGESGNGARPMHPDWARSIRDQCTAAGVAFLFKQAGEVLAGEWRCKSKKGTDPAEWPEDFPREYPA